MTGQGGSAGSPSSAGKAGQTGGSAGSLGAGAGGATGEAGGSGGTTSAGGSVAEGARAACDWAGSTCITKSCQNVCPTTDGGDCSKRCGQLITCIKATSTCATELDPMCVLRGMNGAPNDCTMPWETAGSSPSNPGPSQVATEYFECACDEMVPGSKS